MLGWRLVLVLEAGASCCRLPCLAPLGPTLMPHSGTNPREAHQQLSIETNYQENGLEFPTANNNPGFNSIREGLENCTVGYRPLKEEGGTAQSVNPPTPSEKNY